MIRVSVSGLSELQSRFDAISGDKQDELMTQCFERGARTIQASVQGFAPARSGKTRSAVVVKTTKTKRGSIITRVQLDKGFYRRGCLLCRLSGVRLARRQAEQPGP